MKTSPPGAENAVPWKPFSQCPGALWKREIQENTEKSRTQNEMAAGAWRPTEPRTRSRNRAPLSHQQDYPEVRPARPPSDWETRLRHTRTLQIPELGGLGGGASSPAACRPDGQGLGTRRLLERSRATGWGEKKSERCPGPSPWKADPGQWLVSRSSRAWGRGKETSETRHLSPRKTSQAGELGRPARLLLLECVPTHSGGLLSGSPAKRK